MACRVNSGCIDRVSGGDAPITNKTQSSDRSEKSRVRLPEPRLLTKSQAANYCALSVRGFARWVKVGRLPGPIAGTTRWDRRAVDAALDEAMNLTAKEDLDSYDNWKVRHHENQLKRHSHSKKKTHQW